MPRGRFITLEGGEGCGKTTQSRRLASWLESLGVETVLVREPGGTPLGEEIRRLLKGVPGTPGPCDRAELLLFLAARAQLVRDTVRPALERGAWVVSDRFSDSTLAYQGAGRGLPGGFVAGAVAFACDGVAPDLTLLLRAPRETALARIGSRGEAADRIEAEGEAFHARIAECFDSLAREEPERIVPVDASGAPDEVAALVQKTVRERLAPGRAATMKATGG